MQKFENVAYFWHWKSKLSLTHCVNLCSLTQSCREWRVARRDLRGNLFDLFARVIWNHIHVLLPFDTRGSRLTFLVFVRAIWNYLHVLVALPQSFILVCNKFYSGRNNRPSYQSRRSQNLSQYIAQQLHHEHQIFRVICKQIYFLIHHYSPLIHHYHRQLQYHLEVLRWLTIIIPLCFKHLTEVITLMHFTKICFYLVAMYRKLEVGNETVVWEPLVNAIRREYFSLRDSNKLKCRHIVPFYELI